MDRFLALHWISDDGARTQLATRWIERLLHSPSDWQLLLDQPGLRVLATRRRDVAPAAVCFDAGVIIGTLFETGSENLGQVQKLSHPISEALRRNEPSGLLKRYWGNYVALWRSDDGAVSVLRDPCAALPCYKASVNGIEVIASHAADIADLSDHPFAIDWGFLQAFFLDNYRATEHTGLVGLAEILPGQCVRWRDGVLAGSTLAWDSVSFCKEPAHISRDRARAELRDVVERCVSAWAGVYREFAVRLSGGIDSTILLALLARAAPERVLALHLVGEDYEGHELSLARLAAEHARVKLVEITVPHAPDLRGLLHAPRLSRPSKQLIGMFAEDAITEACDAHGIDCVTVGHGGDALFLQRALTEHIARDQLELRGPSPSLFRVASSVAILQEQSLWTVVRNSFLRRATISVTSLIPADGGQRSLLSPAAIDVIPSRYLASPLSPNGANLPPGKLQQQKSVMALRAYHAVKGHGEERDVLLPFFAQPIVEYCLRLPTFCFTDGGIDRSLERSAFADLIPPEIVRRSVKGLINRKLLVAIEHNLSFLREFLLDGVVMKQGWILKRDVERSLTREHLFIGRDMEGVYNLIAAEAWARSWRA